VLSAPRVGTNSPGRRAGNDAAGETCPVWPGRPASAHRGIPDPAKATGTPAEIQLAFDQAYRMLATRIAVFLSLPLEKLDRAALHQHLHDIGRIDRVRGGLI
jgi:hypothetical protein